MIEVEPVRHLSGRPSLSAYLGNTFADGVLDEINQASESITGSIFGSRDDPFADDYAMFEDRVVTRTRLLAEEIDELEGRSGERNLPRLIDRESDLFEVPPSMYLPILSHKPIRKLFKERMIYGWGVDPDTLRDEDPLERALDYGIVDMGYEEIPDTVRWSWRDDDPELAFDDQVMFRRSRTYIETYLRQAMKDHMRDPTDRYEGGRIGRVVRYDD